MPKMSPTLMDFISSTKVMKRMNFFRSFSSCLHEEEPLRPIISTSAVPGPKSLKLKEELNILQNAAGVNYFVDLERSRGNYVADADGNLILDAYTMIASLPLGYNHPDLIGSFKNPQMTLAAVNRPSLGYFPSIDYGQKLKSALLSIAPKGMNEIQTMMCGSCANENAMKAVFIRRMTKMRGSSGFTPEHLESTMINQPPGSPRLCILSFHGAFHGRTLGCLSTTHSKAIHKLDIPAFDWPIAPFPRYKYPLDENVQHNENEDKKCLSEVENLIKIWNEEKGIPVAGLIVEPIQAEGGDYHASNSFFKNLRALTKKYDCAMIVDEVQTGCGSTGRMWAHEYWNLDEPPDIVTFSKKMLLGGYFYTHEYRVQEPFRIFNTWMGDPIKLALLQVVIEVIKRDQLLKLTDESGRRLVDGLTDLRTKYPNLLNNVRSKGTFAAVDATSVQVRNKFMEQSLNKGLQLGVCGDKTIRFRPALIFGSKHVDIALNIIDDTLKALS